MKIVKVDWVDSMAVSGWRAVKRDFTEKDFTCTTTGFLAHSDKTYLLLAASLSDPGEEDTDINNVMIIPRSAVRKITVLRK